MRKFIPRCFHQIWINSLQPNLPDEFATYAQTWRTHHPDWNYCLWNLENIDFNLQRPELLGQCLSYAAVADILRLEILYAKGGVYIDTDFECFRSIDKLIQDQEFIGCSENGQVISIGLIAAQPGSSILECLLKKLPNKLGLMPPNFETGPMFVTRTLLQEGFTNGVSLLPSKWFYPYSMQEPRVTAITAPYAYAAHHWAHSWANEKDRTLSSGVRRKLFGAPKQEPVLS